MIEKYGDFPLELSSKGNILFINFLVEVSNPHSAPQTVPEGNYGDEKSKLA